MLVLPFFGSEIISWYPNLTYKLLQSSPSVYGSTFNLSTFLFFCPTIYKLRITLILHSKLIKLIDISDEWSNFQFLWTILSLERSYLWDFHQHLSRKLRPKQAFFRIFGTFLCIILGWKAFSLLGFKDSGLLPPEIAPGFVSEFVWSFSSIPLL